MNTIKLEKALNHLSEEEKMEAIAYLNNSISKTWIVIDKNENVCGGEACIIRTRIPVWSLVSYKLKGWEEEKFLQNFSALRLSDLSNAWIYYKLNGQEIDKAILENEDF
ncbi:MAG: DUF433 domain-containing protein [Leptospiraceae bacterium]|nr:DUF433 domain-containing protein [Leptospiraceae bacterium]